MIYTSCKFMIPAQYKYGLSASQPGWSSTSYGSYLYDYSVSTFGLFPSSTGSLYITFNTPCSLNQLCVLCKGRRSPGSGYIVPVCAGSALPIPSYNPDYGNSNFWLLSGTTGFYKPNITGSSTNISWCLFNLTNSGSDVAYEMDIQGGSYGGSNAWYHVVWSETFSLNLWNREASLNMSFSQPLAKTSHENSFDSWGRVKSFQVETRRHLEWSGLTSIQFGVFESAFLAFGDSIKKPFVIARITDAGSGVNNEAEFMLVCMTSYPKYSKDKSGLYSLSLDLVEINSVY